jgi:tetratricopeptide (TPR) repeat protein
MAKKKAQRVEAEEKALAKPVQKVKLEINTDRLEESVRMAVEKVQYWYRQGMIRKIRLKYKGKAVLPDIPLSYFMLVQVATFFLTGVVRALAISLGARVFFEVEMVNDAEELFRKARDLYLDGDLDEAVQLLQDAITLDKNFAEAYLYLGIIHKIRKEPAMAARFFQQAQKLDPAGRAGVEAGKNLKKLPPPSQA